MQECPARNRRANWRSAPGRASPPCGRDAAPAPAPTFCAASSPMRRASSTRPSDAAPPSATPSLRRTPRPTAGRRSVRPSMLRKVSRAAVEALAPPFPRSRCAQSGRSPGRSSPRRRPGAAASTATAPPSAAPGRHGARGKLLESGRPGSGCRLRAPRDIEAEAEADRRALGVVALLAQSGEDADRLRQRLVGSRRAATGCAARRRSAPAPARGCARSPACAAPAAAPL